MPNLKNLLDAVDMIATPAEAIDEIKFQAWARETPWYKEFVQNYGKEPDLNTPDYNLRGAWKAGLTPQRDPYDIKPNPLTGLPAPEGGRYHWQSSTPSGEMLKGPNHPTLWMEYFMRRTGINPESLGLTTKEEGAKYIENLNKQRSLP